MSSTIPSGREFVRTMSQVRERALYLAQITSDAYSDAARHACGMSRSDRAHNLLESRRYDRRALRIIRRYFAA